MPRIFSNGPNKDYVINPFNKLLKGSKNSYLAAPYFTTAEAIFEAANAGTNIQLIIGLNPSTNPKAIAKLMSMHNVSIRYFTNRFHAKIYIFDADDALLGSSNLRCSLRVKQFNGWRTELEQRSRYCVGGIH